MKLVYLSGFPRSLAESLRKQGIEAVSAYSKRFPDGETYVRLPTDLRGEDIVLAQSLYPSQDSKVLELLLAIDAAKGLGCKIQSVLIPYMAYARQDRRFLDGEPISIHVILKCIRSLGVDKVITVDVHKEEALKNLDIKIINIRPHAYIAKKYLTDVHFVLAPDIGAIHRAKDIAEALGVPYDYLEKYRDRVTGEITVKEKELDIRDKNVVIVDDIVSTGGTLAKAISALKKYGAKKVYAVVSHALLVEKAVEKLESVGIDKLITFNTIEHTEKPKWMKILDIADIISEALKKIHEL